MPLEPLELLYPDKPKIGEFHGLDAKTRELLLMAFNKEGFEPGTADCPRQCCEQVVLIEYFNVDQLLRIKRTLFGITRQTGYRKVETQ